MKGIYMLANGEGKIVSKFENQPRINVVSNGNGTFTVQNNRASFFGIPYQSTSVAENASQIGSEIGRLEALDVGSLAFEYFGFEIGIGNPFSFNLKESKRSFRYIPRINSASTETLSSLNLSEDFINSALGISGKTNQGLSNVARQLQKHASRDGVFKDVNFSHKTANKQGLEVLNEIINSKNKSIKSLKNGTTNVFDRSTGRGFNISREGLFNGFRELKK